jgi:hypothetical protein
MRKKKLKPVTGRPGNLVYSLILLTMIFLFNGCTGKGDLRFKPLPDASYFDISGTIKLPEIVETDLSASIRGVLGPISDFTLFRISAGGITAQVAKDGAFSLSDVPLSTTMVLKAVAGKIVLLRRVPVDELYYSDLSKMELNLQTTAEALIWQLGIEEKKDLTVADIRAREYENLITSVVTALKLALQLPDNSVTSDITAIAAVKNAARTAARTILERESILRESNTVMRHILLRKDLELLKAYLSPSFSNDWDSTSSWDDAISHFTGLFADFSFELVDWTIKDVELLPDSRARIRTQVRVQLKNLKSEEIVRDKTWLFDAIWRKEGSFWKIYRNMPYRDSHPTQVNADTRWGEIADAHRELQAALATENLATFSARISQSFGNDWDANSTRNELLLTTQSRFNAMDVKIAAYSIDNIEFYASDMARVKCSAQIRVINLLPGTDIDSGLVKAVIDWRKEDGIWKVYRNLPYRFSHPRNLE